MTSKVKSLHWVGSSKKDYQTFPEEVQYAMGYGLYLAQEGKRAESAKSLKGFGGTSVVELIEDHHGDTYRAVYTVQFSEAVYVLHAFQKKSKSGIATPKTDIDLIKRRYREAQADHREFVKGRMH
ncbi:MAG: type II toxin-antitoxin system RelE/ParE family toxin [Rhodospirillaceae bacterium]|nr:type II toxin-antitoxin system RelE/ParE family toxin [Rhodospirillaceae bacterium]